MNIYHTLKETHTAELAALNKKSYLVGSLRLICIVLCLLCLVAYYKLSQPIFMISFAALVVGFFILMKFHDALFERIKRKKALIRINQNEIDYLEGKRIPFEDGAEYTDPAHAYSYDLDVFGKNSLFQNINRTECYAGKKKLAASLLVGHTNPQILLNQDAIKELTGKIELRQDLSVLARFSNDSPEVYQHLVEWADRKDTGIPGSLKIVSYVLPAITIAAIACYILFSQDLFYRIASFAFLANLSVLFSKQKRIKQEIANFDRVQQALSHYGLFISRLEQEGFESKHLNTLKESLSYNQIQASVQLKYLAALCRKLNSMNNAFASFILNGLYLYHLHVFWSLLKWKKAYARQIPLWLEVIGEFEMLNSYANFAYNNPGFSYPELNQAHELQFKDLGHPLIGQKKRIVNDVTFADHKFIILTGSNMSGKSTFLRTLGVNMILAKAGSPVCASFSSIHPLPVLVSMRLTDSLHENQSYFFAEVRRLKEIMDALSDEVCFVILDEILKGTNSEDKRTGTIGIIKQVIAKKGIGAIATHDLKICDTTLEYPDYLSNQCFEAQVIDNELFFDHKLREGICQNKSATFLLKKMGII